MEAISAGSILLALPRVILTIVSKLLSLSCDISKTSVLSTPSMAVSLLAIMLTSGLSLLLGLSSFIVVVTLPLPSLASATTLPFPSTPF